MCEFLFSILDIVLSLVAQFSVNLANNLEGPAYGFLNETFGCDI